MTTAAPLCRLACAQVPVRGTSMQVTVFGSRDGEEEQEDVVAVRTLGPSEPGRIPLVRVHSACFTGDVLGSSKCDCGMQLSASLKIIEAHGDGALLYLLRQEGRGIGLANKIRAYALQAVGHDTVSANLALGLPVEQRDFEVAAGALRLLGMDRVHLLTNNPLKIQALSGYGLRVESRVPLGGFRTGENEEYLASKDRDMGHLDALGVAGLPLPAA